MSAAPTGIRLYDRTADDAAAAVIARYSTSFALATRTLGPRVRTHVRNVYALVRVADEIVDGPALEAGLTADAAGELLDELEADAVRAIAEGFSANLIVHAFARTARECGIGDELIAPFFASMRTDLSTAVHDERSHDSYVYGSAEVIGLMCLHIFVSAGLPAPAMPAPELVEGARRLGAAFQDVNFLRDLADDSGRLGRDYLGGADDIDRRIHVLDRIDADLAAAAAVVPLLPPDCRRAVCVAHDLFWDLSRRLRADDARTTRVRVPDTAKARLALHSMITATPRTTP